MLLFVQNVYISLLETNKMLSIYNNLATAIVSNRNYIQKN